MGHVAARFSSKGFNEAFQVTANKTIQKLWKSSQEGKVILLQMSRVAQNDQPSQLPDR
jgi:hypothetical protein